MVKYMAFILKLADYRRICVKYTQTRKILYLTVECAIIRDWIRTFNMGCIADSTVIFSKGGSEMDNSRSFFS